MARTEKIMLDAGHGGFDNGASYELSDGTIRREKEDNLELSLAVGKALSSLGYPVLYTRTEDIYQTPPNKAAIANSKNADYFISIHRNAAENPNQYNGIQTLLYDQSGIKNSMAENINAGLQKIGFQNLGIEERKDLAVLRRTRMPALLIEAGFIDSDKDNALFDEKNSEIANAIANGIDRTLQGRKQGETAAGEEMYDFRELTEEEKDYFLLLNVFSNQEMAEQYVKKLQDNILGIHPENFFVRKEKNLHLAGVLLGSNQVEARKREKTLQSEYGLCGIMTCRSAYEKHL